MKKRHFMSNTHLGAAAAVVVMGMYSSVAMAGETCFEDQDFEDCKVLIEINSSDGDIGFHFLMDGDDLNSARIFDPNGVKVFEDQAKGPLREQKLTETFTESAEPLCFDPAPEDEDFVTLEEFLERWEAGTYTFTGSGDGGEKSEGETELTHEIPAAPTGLGFDGSVISWAAGDDLGQCATKAQLAALVALNPPVLLTHPEFVPVDAWEVVLEPEDDAQAQFKFTIRVPLSQTSVTVPADYILSLPANTPAKIEVGAIGADDNATFTELGGQCVHETTGCP